MKLKKDNMTEKLTTEELSVIMESNQVLWSVDMYGSDPV